jgi:hypothetical protein
MSTVEVKAVQVVTTCVLEVAESSTGAAMATGTVMMVAPPVLGLESSPQPSAF